MDFLLRMNYELIILFSLLVFLNLLVLLSLALLYLKIQKFQSGAKGIAGGDRRLKAKIAKDLEKKASDQLVGIINTYSQILDRETKKHFLAVADDALRQSRYLATFVQEQEKVIAKESQYLVATSVVKVQKELDEYRKAELAKINTQINSIISEVAKRVLSKTVDLSNHQELIMEALERAKADKLF